MTAMRIPYYIDPPPLSPYLLAEITRIIFGDPVEVEPCDIIFIFGGSHPGLWEKASEAYFKGLGSDIIVTGGYKPDALRHSSWVDGTTPESVVILRELLRSGVPQGMIYLETRSTNTYENVLYALRAYDFNPVSSVLAICKSYAVGRQVRTLKVQVEPQVKVIPYPFDTHLGGDEPLVTRENWMEFPEARAYMFANLMKIYHYGNLGYLLPFEGISIELERIIQDQTALLISRKK